MLDIKIEKATNLKAKTPDDQLGFGRIFTDHMFIMDYDAGQGWHDADVYKRQHRVRRRPGPGDLDHGQDVRGHGCAFDRGEPTPVRPGAGGYLPWRRHPMGDGSRGQEMCIRDSSMASCRREGTSIISCDVPYHTMLPLAMTMG